MNLNLLLLPVLLLFFLLYLEFWYGSCSFSHCVHWFHCQKCMLFCALLTHTHTHTQYEWNLVHSQFNAKSNNNNNDGWISLSHCYQLQKKELHDECECVGDLFLRFYAKFISFLAHRDLWVLIKEIKRLRKHLEVFFWEKKWDLFENIKIRDDFCMKNCQEERERESVWEKERVKLLKIICVVSQLKFPRIWSSSLTK